MSQRGLAPILVVVSVLVLAVVVGGAYYFGKSSNNSVTPSQQPLTTQPVQATSKPTLIKSSPTPSPQTSSQPKAILKIPILSTSGWKTVTLEGVTFKIPSDFRYEIDPYPYRGKGILLYAPNSIPDRITVQPYLGGSRRSQFYGSTTPGCNDIYEEAQFGNIQALQIAVDVGWCNGGGGGILAVVNNKLFIFHFLGYDINTKEITRWPIRDTIISTVE